MIDDDQKSKLLEHMQQVEENIDAKDIYVYFNGHGHLRYIQATREGLIKLGIFMIQSAFSNETYIHINSEDETLEWIDPDETDPVDYIEIIENKNEFLASNKKRVDNRAPLKDYMVFLVVLLIIGAIVGIVTASAMGVLALIRYALSLL